MILYELISKAIAHIDNELYVSQLQYTVTYAGQKDVLSADMVREGSSFNDAKSKTTTLKHAHTSQVTYDLIGKIAEGTVLTRRTVAKILQGIRPDTFAMYRNNPEEFITKENGGIEYATERMQAYRQKAEACLDHFRNPLEFLFPFPLGTHIIIPALARVNNTR